MNGFKMKMNKSYKIALCFIAFCTLSSCSLIYASGNLAEIEFYAKIVDQYGQPVPGVEVTYNALSGYLAPGGGHNKVYSDEQGRFSIEDVRGISLSVYKMSKLNYDFKLDHVKDFGHYKRFPEYRLWTEHSSPEKAFVFKAWKAEPQVKVESGTTRYYLIPDGRDYSIDLANRFSQFDGKNKGGFNVSYTRSETEWQLVLSAPSGGFIESNEVYMNLAPESGYQETIVLKGERKNEEYIKLKKQYFLKSQKGEFARLSMDIRPFFNDEYSSIMLYFSINMSGTRSLVNTVIEPPRFPDPE